MNFYVIGPKGLSVSEIVTDIIENYANDCGIPDNDLFLTKAHAEERLSNMNSHPNDYAPSNYEKDSFKIYEVLVSIKE